MDNQYRGQITDATARKQPGSMDARRFAFVNEIESRMRPQESSDNQPSAKLQGVRAREVFDSFRSRLQGTWPYPWGSRWHAQGYDPYNTWPAMAIALNDLLFI